MDKTEASKVSELMMDYWHAELAADPTLKVELRARFRNQHNEGPSPRSNEWRFTLKDGTEIDIPNRYRPDIGPDTRESVAWALAKALGYDLPVAQPEPMVAVIG